MLHRAATTAYSWWWASHIRTKQSKWLEQNLQDMEEKVKSIISIIDQEGDSFAKRAEMYYKKRPELINFVEESYKAYRSLAERFDHISKDLQSANRTIATVFPGQVQLDLDSDDEESLSGSTAPSPDRQSTKNAPPVPKNLPKAPKLPKKNPKANQSVLASKREQLRRNLASSPMIISSGLSKEEATKEIDILQKDILSLQTEKEFVKSAYENALAKFLEIENKITESQSRVCSLQDEFGIGTVMEDHEARSLMADSALKSCEEALVKLQNEHEKSMEEVKEECRKVKKAQERIEALKKLHKDENEPEEELKKSMAGSKEAVLNPDEDEHDQDLDIMREKIREQFKLSSDANVTAPEIAEKIDDLVEKIIKLETTICSLNALIKSLRQDVETLLGDIRSLEEQTQSSNGDSAMKVKLREFELELIRVKQLNQELTDKRNNITAEITNAGCNLEQLKQKLPNMKSDEDAENLWLSKEPKTEQEIELQKEDVESDGEKDEEDEEKQQPTSKMLVSTHDIGLPSGEQDGLNWRQLYMNNIEDRERILVEEYTIILRDYKNMKTKLSEMEKTHRDDNYELKLLVEELKNTLAAKDQEIEMLRKMLSDLQNSSVNSNAELSNDNDSSLDEANNLKKDEQNDDDDDDETSDQTKKPLFHHLYDRDAVMKKEFDEEDDKISPIIKGGGERRVKINLVTKTRPVSRTEGKFRAEMDNLLEANLDFWLRFSTSFHQIQKFQTSIKDLLAELTKLKESSQKNSENDKSQQSSAKSDARPLYKHLREIETELTLWLEHSAVFQEELRSRFSSLNNIQDEITKVSTANNNGEERKSELSDFQAAKFQGEILNMKQENSKVAEELQAGIHRVKALKIEVGKALSKLDKEFGFLESKSRSYSLRHTMSKSRIPLRSLLFGMRLKRSKQKSAQSVLASENPTLTKRISLLEYPH